jgi:hypothetical protein
MYNKLYFIILNCKFTGGRLGTAWLLTSQLPTAEHNHQLAYNTHLSTGTSALGYTVYSYYADLWVTVEAVAAADRGGEGRYHTYASPLFQLVFAPLMEVIIWAKIRRHRIAHQNDLDCLCVIFKLSWRKK